MKTMHQKLIATAAAVMLTSASLGAVSYNVDATPANAMEIHGIKVTNLAPVTVYPTAGVLRSASLLVGAVALASLSTRGRMGEVGATTQLSLIGSQLTMPYYSFGNEFGRISKE